MNPLSRSLLTRLGGTLRDVLRPRCHSLSAHPLQDAERQADGRLHSTGFEPRLDLVSDRGDLPTRWCWLEIETESEDRETHPHLLVHRAGSDTPERIILAPPRPEAPPVLIRLPDAVDRIQLRPCNRPGPIGLRSVRMTQVPRSRLLATLIGAAPRSAWDAVRRAPTFAHFKARLIAEAGAARLHGLARHWMAVYGSGAHPSAIPRSGTASFSVIVPVAAGSDRDEAVAGVAAQTYPHWQLIRVDDTVPPRAPEAAAADAGHAGTGAETCASPPRPWAEALRAAAGDYLLILDRDQVIEPHALARLAAAAAREGADVVYGDGVVVGEDDAFVALQAWPAFSHDDLMAAPLEAPMAIRTALARDAFAPDDTPACSLDLLLRVLARDPVVTHVPDVLYRSRARGAGRGRQEGDAPAAALRAAHLRGLGFGEATVKADGPLGTFTVRYHAGPRGRVLAVIPTKDRHPLLETCIRTLRATTASLDLDICVVDHQSTEPATLAYLEALAQEGVRVLPYAGPFNFSALNNAAVARFGRDHDHVLFLNNDVEAERDGWLAAMLDLALRADVGVVGATLLYPDRRVQHAGVIVGMNASAEHAYRFAAPDHNAGVRRGLAATRRYSAVTGACMLVRADAFRAVGGYDEKLAVGYNDIDLCLRIGAAGYRVLNCAEARLVHHESASRGLGGGGDPHPEDTRRFKARHARILEAGDPFFSPLLDPRDPLFAPAPLALRQTHVEPRTVSRVLPVADGGGCARAAGERAVAPCRDPL